MVDLRPLTPIILVVGLISLAYGYLEAYTGPYFVLTLHDAGYGYEAIAALMATLNMFWIASGFGVLVLIVLVSYHYGSRYRLTMVSGFVLIVLVYLTQLSGHLVGLGVYQIQTPRFPIFLVSYLQHLVSYSYVVYALIGVLAANYGREIRQKQSSEQPRN